MGLRNSLSFLFVILLGIFVSSQAYDFIVGGKDGWVLKPSESYSQWAQRNRFQVNDTLVFKYNQGGDSVLAVNKQDYDTCNTSSPLRKMDDGDSRYMLGNPGPFYFISGNQTSCQNGQKLVVVVLTPRNKSPPSGGAAPQSSPPSPSAGAAPSPSGGAPSPNGGAPPQSSPPSASAGPAPSPSGGVPSPSGGAAPQSSPPSPIAGAAPSPSDGGPTPGGGGTPSGGTPSPSGDGSGSGGTPGDQSQGEASPPNNNSSPALTSSIGFALALSLLVTIASSGFVGSF